MVPQCSSGSLGYLASRVAISGAENEDFVKFIIKKEIEELSRVQISDRILHSPIPFKNVNLDKVTKEVISYLRQFIPNFGECAEKKLSSHSQVQDDGHENGIGLVESDSPNINVSVEVEESENVSFEVEESENVSVEVEESENVSVEVEESENVVELEGNLPEFNLSGF